MVKVRERKGKGNLISDNTLSLSLIYIFAKVHIGIKLLIFIAGQKEKETDRQTDRELKNAKKSTYM